MILFSTEQIDKLYANGCDLSRCHELFPVAKLILPGTGCSWLLSGLGPQGEQFGYGLSDYGLGHVEIGYINLMALSGMTDPWNRHRVKIDRSFVPKYPLSVYEKVARAFGAITDDEVLLSNAA